MNLKFQLQTLKKAGLSMKEYLIKMKPFVIPWLLVDIQYLQKTQCSPILLVLDQNLNQLLLLSPQELNLIMSQLVLPYFWLVRTELSNNPMCQNLLCPPTLQCNPNKLGIIIMAIISLIGLVVDSMGKTIMATVAGGRGRTYQNRPVC